MKIERIQVQTTIYSSHDAERLEAETKKTVSADAVSFDSEKDQHPDLQSPDQRAEGEETPKDGEKPQKVPAKEPGHFHWVV
ncbi:MAG: hypothetical protein K1X83_06095 [Oligoflexia bacterium]|nr:hypothetical protein [Oligoflexia bacterium]